MLVPIACRFVPLDQWLVTHLDDTAKVKHAKLWFLSKCNLVQSPGPHSQRAVSPIVFASAVRSRSSLDSLDDGYNEDDEFSDQDLPAKHTVHPLPHRDPPSHPASPLVDQYSLISFSTGSILEDEFPLSWYSLRPYELLEMHPVGTVAPLQRDVLADYVQPYFQAKVRVLRAVWNHRSGRFEAPGSGAQREYGGHSAMDKLAHRLDTLSSISQSEKKRKTKVDWKARRVVIDRGILFLCKEHVTNPPLHQFALSNMTALRGADAFGRAFSIVTQPRVLCIEFRPRSASLIGVASPPPSTPSSPISEELKANIQEPFPCLDSLSDLKQTAELDNTGEYAYDPNDAHKGGGEWVVLDMLDDHAFSSMLRILHRQASHPISSSFVPSSSIITISHPSIPPTAVTSFASYDTIPYPEWRINTVENARKAGMGDVGKAMAWVLWTEKGLGESLLGNIRHHRQAFSREMQYKIPAPSDGSNDESDDESEMEWEGWMRDLDRQSRVKQQSGKASKSVASRQTHVPIGTMSSSLPSPPLSEASPSGSPRVRSPSLSASHLVAGPSGSHPHAQYQYPNIGNVIQASRARYRSIEHLRSSEKIRSTTVSTVSVGAAPSSRRRSSTLLAELGTTTRRDKSERDREPFPVNGTRATARTVSISAGMKFTPSLSVRHARSSSNLRVSSSPYGSDAAESVGHPGPSPPSKRQGSFMRGMSLRAGKLVRGLESAIDFVDEKTT